MGMATATALREAGLSVSQDELDFRIATAIRELTGTHRLDNPEQEFNDDEQVALREGGFDLAYRPTGEIDPSLQAAERYAAILATALTVPQAAQRLGVDASRIRQRLLARQMYGIRQRRGWLIPLYQFTERGLVPGLDRVLRHLDPKLHPLAVISWFTIPKLDLYRPGDAEESPVSPCDWLLSGGDPTVVAELADDAAGYR